MLSGSVLSDIGDVFWKSLGLEWSVFAAFFAATFLILYGWFLALWQMHQSDLPHDRAIFIGRQQAQSASSPLATMSSAS